jgi:hypothetical protein
MNISCPFCNRALFRRSQSQGPYAGTRWDAPHVANDQGGYYVICPNRGCAREVRMSPRIGGLFVSPAHRQAGA